MTRSRSATSMTEGEEAFARAAWDLLQDVERSLGVRIRMGWYLSTRKGVFVLLLSAHDVRDTRQEFPKVQLRHDWPNGHAVSMGAFLFQQANMFAQMCESWSLDQRGQGAKS